MSRPPVGAETPSTATATAADTGADDDSASQASDGQTSDDGAATQAAGDYSACLVTDISGVDDRSFNETTFAGLERAEEELGIEAKVLESTSATDYETHINAFLAQDCDLIVTVGFLLGDATAEAAQANPDQKFAIVDVDYATEDGEDISYDNVRELYFATEQAAFLVGYSAAAYSRNGTIATYGGMNIPPITDFMDGYFNGATYYNAQHDADVAVQGWDGDDGQFTGDFEDQTKARNITEQFMQNGADVVMPVGGNIGQGTGAAMRAAGTGAMIWVDTDGYVSLPQFSELILTSVMKNMDVAAYDTIKADIDGEFEGGLYLGTLENDGVQMAPFHDFEDEVSDEVKAELDEIRQGIIDGDISADGDN